MPKNKAVFAMNKDGNTFKKKDYIVMNWEDATDSAHPGCIAFIARDSLVRGCIH